VAIDDGLEIDLADALEDADEGLSRRADRAATKPSRLQDMMVSSTLLDIHQRLDTAVAEAYRWPANLDNNAILEGLVALNRERAEEEKRGLIRWLRPEYQAPRAKAAQPVQEEMAVGEAATLPGKAVWPKALPDQFQALNRLLDEAGQPIEVRQAAKRFKGARGEKVEELLQALVALGQARALPGRRYGR